MATLQGKAVKNTYRQVLQIGANNVGVSGTLQPVQDGGGVNTSLSLSTTAATITGTLTINGDLIITGGGIQIQDLIDDTVASLIQNGTGITWAYNDSLRTLTPTITIATADGGVQGDFLQLNTGAGEANAVAKMYWNNVDGTNNLGLMGGNVILPIGQKQVARVLNNSGSILNKASYQVVKVAAAQGQRLAVALAQANNDANSTDTLGLVAENIANNQEGFITTSGLITDVDTTGDLQLQDWNDGDVLYLSPTTPGAITKVKPVAPQHTIIVGFVVYAHKTQGKIFVKVDNGYEIDELHNVRITNVANDNILQYNSSLAVWENVAGTTTNIAEGTNLYYTQGRFDSAFAAKSTTNLAEGTNLYFTTARGDANFATNFATKDTDDLPEGSTNLYYTNTRTRNALSVTAGTGIAYNSTTGNFNLGSIPNSSLTNSSVTINGLSLALGASISLTTSNIAEGTNLYWTDARFDSRFGTKTTTNLAEGSNLYYTQARFNTAFDAKTTTDLDEGTNLYYTDARSRAAFSENAVGLDYSSGSGILSLTAGYAIPTTVKLGQYDTAYNRSIVSAAVTGTSTKTLSLTQQDANVITASWTDQGITTINGTANQIAASTVGNTTTVGFTNDVTFPNNVVVSGNLTINGTATYVNTQSISSKDPLFEVANDNNTTDAVDIGYYGRYFDSAQTRVEFTGLFRDASDAGKFKFFTGLVDEPTNVVDTTGTGYTVGTLVANVEGNLAGTANAANVLSTARTISATGDAAWSVSFDGSANATAALTLANTGVTASTYGTTTAVPTIAIDSKGRITSASNTNIAFPVLSVNSQSGNVVLTTSNVAEGTNQYFTTGRVAAYLSGAISTVLTTDLTASRAVASNASGKLVSSATTDTELGYLSGVTSAIQTQLNTKALDSNTVHISGTETITGAKTFSAALAGTSATFSSTVRSIQYYAESDNSSSAPNQFQVNGATNSNKQLIIGYNTTGNGYGSIQAIFQGVATTNLALQGNGGNVGIGMNNPLTLLSIENSGTQNVVSAIITSQSSGTTYAGMYSIRDGAGDQRGLIFQNFTANVGLTEKMRITSGGDVGIGGTPTAGQRLNVFNTVDFDIKLRKLANGGTVGILFETANDFSGTSQAYIKGVGAGNSGAADLIFGTGAGGGATTGTERVRINSAGNVYIQRPASGSTLLQLSGSAAYGDTSTINLCDGRSFIKSEILVTGNGATDIRFGTYNDIAIAERMRITSGGYLKVSNNGVYNGLSAAYHEFNLNVSDSPTLVVKHNGSSPYGIFTAFSTDPNNTTNYIFQGYSYSSSTNLYTIWSNGTVSGRSDMRLKKNIIDSTPKLDKLMQLRVVNYEWKESINGTKELGLIAQEVEEVFPNLVITEPIRKKREIEQEDGTIVEEEYIDGDSKSVKNSVLPYITIKALQELTTLVKEQQAQIEELKAMIAAK